MREHACASSMAKQRGRPLWMTSIEPRPLQVPDLRRTPEEKTTLTSCEMADRDLL